VSEQGQSGFADREAEERFAAEHPNEHMRRRAFLAKTAVLAGAAGLATALGDAGDHARGHVDVERTGREVVEEEQRLGARDGGPATIDCGAGSDTVYVDRSEDGVVNCETVITP